jgi:aminocarboxymuconate-semialdehyde decarboxylase
MDRSGVDIQVISSAPFLYLYALGAKQGLGFAQRINNELAKVAASRPDHFRAMATVPLQDVILAVAELERAVREQEIQGVEIGSNVRWPTPAAMRAWVTSSASPS